MDNTSGFQDNRTVKVAAANIMIYVLFPFAIGNICSRFLSPVTIMAFLVVHAGTLICVFDGCNKPHFDYNNPSDRIKLQSFLLFISLTAGMMINVFNRPQENQAASYQPS